jgi:hypothetical protein
MPRGAVTVEAMRQFWQTGNKTGEHEERSGGRRPDNV